MSELLKHAEALIVNIKLPVNPQLLVIGDPHTPSDRVKDSLVNGITKRS